MQKNVYFLIETGLIISLKNRAIWWLKSVNQQNHALIFELYFTS